MKNIKDYDTHPAARLFPLLDSEQTKELAKDIQAHGLHCPIVLHEGAVLDGRNRLIACGIAGVSPRFVAWEQPEGVSPTEWVLSVNLHRRHLTASQKAAVAAQSLPLLEEEAKARQVATLKKGNEKPDVPKVEQREAGRSVEKAAKIAGVGKQYVSDAKRIQKEAPEEFAKIVTGEKTISEVKKERWEKGKPGVLPAEHAPEDDDSENLWTLKRYWKKATKKEKTAFLEWVDNSESKTKSK